MRLGSEHYLVRHEDHTETAATRITSALAAPVSQVSRYTPLTDLPELLRPEEAAMWLGVSPGTVCQMASGGGLASRRVGRLLRILRSALDAMVTDR